MFTFRSANDLCKYLISRTKYGQYCAKEPVPAGCESLRDGEEFLPAYETAEGVRDLKIARRCPQRSRLVREEEPVDADGPLRW